jgi:hypothetical protein
MFQYHNPPAWTYYDSNSPPRTPPYSYTPQYTTSPQSRPTSKHARKASYTPTKESEWYARYSSSPEYDDGYADYHHKNDHVSSGSGMKSKTRRFSVSTGGNKHGRESRMQEQYIYVDVPDCAENSPGYNIRSEPRPRSKKQSTDQWFYYNQVPVYDEEPQPKRSRARRASTTTKSPQKPKSSPPRPHPKATAADAGRAGIPAGFSIKNWDPTESPILLLGSVFDANSLGKWIYDWTVFHHGASTPMADVAGDLWLLLIKLAGKMKRADECLPRVKGVENREMVHDFLDCGDRLWNRLEKLLKACETFMWKAAKMEGKAISMGKNAGCEFVESIFGRDRELENTEKLMNSVRLWNMRFDANIEDILKRPSVA